MMRSVGTLSLAFLLMALRPVSAQQPAEKDELKKLRAEVDRLQKQVQGLEARLKKLEPDAKAGPKKDERRKGRGKFDPEQFKKFAERAGRFGGKKDPEQLKKLMERFGGKIDPEMLKKLIEGSGKIDPDQLRKLIEKMRQPRGDKKGDRKPDEKRRNETFAGPSQTAAITALDAARARFRAEPGLRLPRRQTVG